MKKVSKVLTATISCLMATTLIMPVNAEGEVEKKESVYTVLNSDGSVNTITVSDTLHSDSGFSNYEDKSDLQNVENLKSSDAVNSSNGNLIWNTSDSDIYYQGTSNKELPLTVKITYTLDGNEITSDELVGKSGHLAIKINVTNSSKQTYTTNNKTYNLVTPFVTGVVCMMDDDTFSNVKVNSGTVTSDSSHSLIASVMVPGLKSGLKQVLDTDLMHKLEDYLIDEITIEADVTNYESPTLMMAAATSTDALKEEFDDIDDFSSIFDKLDDLKEATNELIDGTSSLYDGAVKLNDGVATLKDGANTLSSGAIELYNGVDTLAGSASELASGLAELSGNSEALNSGMSTAFEGLCTLATATINTQLSANGMEEITLTPSTYSNVLSDLLTKLGADEVYKTAYATAKATVTNSVEAKADELYSGYIESIADSVYQKYLETNADSIYKKYVNDNANTFYNAYATQAVYKQAIESGKTEDDAKAYLETEEGKTAIKTAVESLSDDQKKQILDAAPASLTEEQKKQILAGALLNLTDEQKAQIKAGALASLTDDQKTQIREAYIEKMMVSDEVTSRISAAVKKASAAAGSIAELKGKLDSFAYLCTSVGKYTGTVDYVATKTKDLPTGVAKLLDGSKQLKDGASSLNSGVATLKDGSQQLADGAKTLKEGMQKYNDEAISKLTESSRITSLEEASNLLTAMSECEDNYNNYSGISEGTDGSIKFVFKVNGSKKAKSADSSSETTKEKVSFWQRILNLFKF